MAKRMAEIEQRAVATFVFVTRDDVGFDLARPPDRVRQRGRVARQQTFGIRVEPVEELPIDDEAVLDDLGEPGAQLPVGKRRKRVVEFNVGQHALEAASRRERSRQLLRVQRANSRVRGHEHVAGWNRRVQLTLEGKRNRSDEDRIASLAQADVDALHGVNYMRPGGQLCAALKAATIASATMWTFR